VVNSRGVLSPPINRSEPDAALFQPPPDYTVVDEAGDFTIEWRR
jgi:hypothetical protein